MCGIVGALTFDAFEKKSQEKQRTEAQIFITTQLLQSTVERGKDATGIALLWADGNYSGLKMGIPSPSFIARFGEEETEFKGMMKVWRDYPKQLKVFMGHCRKASKGNSYDNKNNHPLMVGDMMFVHNGTLNNDDIIFEKLGVKRSGEVDSEAIGHLLHKLTQNGTEPFTKEVLEETTKRIAGTYSVIATSGNNPFQVAQFRDGRPAEFALVKPLKTVFIASDQKYLENVLFEYNKLVQLFTSGTNSLPYIKQNDVEFKTMIDDSYLIWDLTAPVTDETTIDELYDWGKTPLRVDKIWKGTTTTYNNGIYQSNNFNASKKTVVATTAQTKNTITSGESNNNGLVWSKSLNKYKSQSGMGKTKKYGAVVIDIEKSEIKHISPKDKTDDEKGLTEVDKDRVENLLVGAAKINEIANARILDTMNEVKKTGISAPSRNNKVGVKPNIIEIDMTTDDPEAIKAAAEFIDAGMSKYESDDEVVEKLELADHAVLRALPVYALANRIMKFVFRNGFIAGFSKARAAAKPFDKDTEKLDSAEKKIRSLKILLNLMSTSLDIAVPKEDISDTVLDAIAENFKPGVLKRLNLTEILTVGDLKNIRLMGKVKEIIEKEGEKESK